MVFDPVELERAELAPNREVDARTIGHGECRWHGLGRHGDVVEAGEGANKVVGGCLEQIVSAAPTPRGFCY